MKRHLEFKPFEERPVCNGLVIFPKHPLVDGIPRQRIGKANPNSDDHLLESSPKYSLQVTGEEKTHRLDTTKTHTTHMTPMAI